MAAKSAVLEHLKGVALFSGCSTKELRAIAKAGEEVVMTAGTVVVDQGQFGREAFIVISGDLTVRRSGRKVATLGPGAAVGELALLDHGPRTATVTCDTDCTLFVLDQRHFRSVLEEHPQFAINLLAQLAREIRDLDRKQFG